MGSNSNDPNAENERLYAIDVALVGEDEAPKRWQTRDSEGAHWWTCHVKPLWQAYAQYRRDPNAPPQPSLDWLDAPEEANWLGPNGGWIVDPPRPDWNPIEPRPPQAWFDLMRPECVPSDETAGGPKGLSEHEFWRSLGDEPTDDGIAKTDTETAAAIDRAVLGDGVLSGAAEMLERICKMQERNYGNATSTHIELSALINEWRKPRTRSLTTQDGVVHTWPAPMREAPPHETDYWVPSISSPSLVSLKRWQKKAPADYDIEMGIAHYRKKDAQAHGRALIAASKAEASR